MTYNTISQNNDDHFYTAVCAYVRGEGNGIVRGTVGEEQAEIAKRLLRDSPAILDGKDRLLAEIAAIHFNFVRSADSNGWVCESDLPLSKAKLLYERITRMREERERGEHRTKRPPVEM